MPICLAATHRAKGVWATTPSSADVPRRPKVAGTHVASIGRGLHPSQSRLPRCRRTVGRPAHAQHGRRSATNRCPARLLDEVILRSAAVAAAIVLLAACGSRVAEVSPSTTPAPASPSAAPSRSVSSPSAAPSAVQYPSSAVRIVINAVERPPGSETLVDGIGGTTVVLTFPFPVDRASVDPFLARSGAPSWTDERTVTLAFPESEPSLGFKIPQVRSVDGLSSIDLLIVAIRYVSSEVLSVYTVAGALAPGGPTASGSWRVPVADSVAASPDLSRVLLYHSPRTPSGPPPRVLELATRSLIALSAGDGSFAFGGWLPDGQVLLVGSSVWLGSATAEPLRMVADLSRQQPTFAQPSPAGTYVAVVGADAVSLVNLRDGSVRPVTGSSGSCAPGLAWSRDETLIAWIDCATLAVRITDVASGRTVRTIDGVSRALAALPTGDLIITRDSGQTGEGARSLGVVYGFDGTEKARYLGYAWSVSADGRYLLNIGSCCAGGPSSTISDLRSPSMQPVMLPGLASWTVDGRILVAGSFTR